ncbi:MAG TPA: hypothetical protein VLW52_04085 [Opitutaceae bacterium]|nr:hypothetical protein [Opitutaceae bacterium]
MIEGSVTTGTIGKRVSGRVGGRPLRARCTGYGGKSQGIGTNCEAIFLTNEKSTSVTMGAPAVLNPVDEAAWVSTNDAAQWAVAAMQNLVLAPEALPA